MFRATDRVGQDGLQVLLVNILCLVDQLVSYSNSSKASRAWDKVDA